MNSIHNDIQKERKKLLSLIIEAHSKHKQFDGDHIIGTDNSCEICQIFKNIKDSGNLLKEKLVLLQDDQKLILDFNNLRRDLGRLPRQNEYHRLNEVLNRFETWDKFIEKTTRYYK